MVAQYVIYGLVDPLRPSMVRYVGKSATPTGRLLEHVRGSSGSAVEEWVAMLREQGRYPDMVLLEAVRPCAYGRERHWFRMLRAEGQADLNGNTPKHCVDFPDDERAITPAERQRIAADEERRKTVEYWLEVEAHVAVNGHRGVSPAALDGLARWQKDEALARTAEKPVKEQSKRGAK